MAHGHKEIKYLDIGGGLGIDYYHGSNHGQSPLSSTEDLIRAIASSLPPSVEVILEPGRSIMANTGMVVYIFNSTTHYKIICYRDFANQNTWS